MFDKLNASRRRAIASHRANDRRVRQRGDMTAHCRIAFLTIALGWMGASCQLAKRPTPSWIATGVHPACPAERSLCAIGQGPSEAQADQAARREIARQVALMMGLPSPAAGVSPDQPAPAWLLPGWPPGLFSVLDRFPADSAIAPEDARHAVLLAATKARMALALSQKADELRERARSLMRFAPFGTPVELPPYLELVSLLAAWNQWHLAASLQKAVRALTPDRPVEPEAPEMQELQSRLSTLISLLELRAAHGADQTLQQEGPLNEPLMVGAYLRQGDPPISLENVPLRLRQPSGSGLSDIRVRTNAFGLASFLVGRVARASGTANTLVAELDVEELGRDAGLDPTTPDFAAFREQLLGLRAEFAYRFPDVAGLPRVMVWIAEPELAEPLVAALGQEGFSIVDPGDRIRSEDFPQTPEEGAALARGQAAVIAFGSVASQPLDRAGIEPLFLAVARVEIQLVDVQNARPIGAVERSAQSAGPTEPASVHRATSVCAQRVVPEVIKLLRRWSIK